jgi:hypothetical protein
VGLLIVGPCDSAQKLLCETYGERFLYGSKESLFARHFGFRRISLNDDYGRMISRSSWHAITYLSKRELFAPKKFRSEKFFRTELNCSTDRAIKREKVVAKSSLITIIALPREE